MELPLDLAAIIFAYLTKGHPVLCDPGYQFVFVDRLGRFMEESCTMTNYWKQLLKRLGSPAIFGPHRCSPPFSLPSCRSQTAVKLVHNVLKSIYIAGSGTFL